jgi:hypothetical protein
MFALRRFGLISIKVANDSVCNYCQGATHTAEIGPFQCPALERRPRVAREDASEANGKAAKQHARAHSGRGSLEQGRQRANRREERHHAIVAYLDAYLARQACQ